MDEIEKIDEILNNKDKKIQDLINEINFLEKNNESN